MNLLLMSLMIILMGMKDKNLLEIAYQEKLLLKAAFLVFR